MAVLGVTLIALCALSTVAVTRLGGALGQILRENYDSVVACQEMAEALERQDSAVLFAANGRVEVAESMLSGPRGSFTRAYAREAANVTLPGEAELVRELDVNYRDYVRQVDRVLASSPAQRSAAYFKELEPRFVAAKAKVTKIRSINQRNMEAADRGARVVARRTLNLALLVTVAALAVTGWVAWRIPKTVLDPVLAFTKHARAIGEGRLDASVSIPDVSELSTLGETMNRMQERLRAYRESSLGELLAAKDLSRATVASMIDPVIAFSSRGEVLLVNEAAEAIFGLGTGERDAPLRFGADIPEPIALARDAVLSREMPLLPQSLADVMRWITGEGERYFLVRASPLRSEDTGGVGAIVVAQDVTRFRRIDALKSDVVATVSHELKTPLTSLRLATHMLLEDATGPLRAVQRELAITARDETERLQSTVNELLDLVRIERDAGALRLAPVDALALLREVAAAHTKIAEVKHVSLNVRAVESRSLVELDAEQISIVLGNLVANAVRHCREGGHVELAASADASDQYFSVADDGEGIPAEQLGRIFERHFSGAEPSTLKGRHGLGLAIAREIATRHGGSLKVESSVGVGSTFRLRIPLGARRQSAEPLAANDQ